MGERLAETYDNETTANGIRERTKTIAGHLKLLRGSAPFYISQELDKYFLLRYKTFLENLMGNYGISPLSTHSAHTYFFVARLLTSYAYNVLELLDEPVIAPLWNHKRKRKTDSHTAFEADRYEVVMTVLRQMFSNLSTYNKPYVRQKIGRDPRIRSAKENSGWGKFENIIWFFENALDCKHHFYHGKNAFTIPGIYSFLGSKMYGYRVGVYELIGVTPATGDAIFPLAALLAAETGLNPSSIFKLHVDCLNEEISKVCGRPCLVYTKPRSKGEKVLAIDNDTFGDIDYTEQNNSPQIDDAEGSQTYWLSSVKSKKVKKIIDLVKSINAPIRDLADENLRDKLFLYWVKDHMGSEGPSLPNDKRFRNWMQTRFKPAVADILVERLNATSPCMDTKQREADLRSELKKESFSIKKYRTSLATKLAEEGAPFALIQMVLGHEDIRTTFGYIERNKLQMRFYKEMSDHLNTILQNSAKYKDKQHEDSTHGNACNMLFPCGPGLCLDPYNPPEQIRITQDWREGERCTAYEKCLLSCKHLIITIHCLPKLISQKQECLIRLNSHQHITGKHFELFLKRVTVINSILGEGVEQGIFSKEEIEWATHVSENYTVDEQDAFLAGGPGQWLREGW